MVQICQSCDLSQETRIEHVWQESYVSLDACEIEQICQRCHLHLPSRRVNHDWQEMSVAGPEGERPIQKCRRCGQTQPDTDAWPELKDWPELETGKNTTALITPPIRKEKIVKGTEKPGAGTVVAYWDPVVIYLLEQMAKITAWDAGWSSDYSDIVPLGITTNITDERIIWKVGKTGGIMGFGNAGAAKEEFFIVTLSVSENFEPIDFVVRSQTLEITTKPVIQNLKAALLRAYSDGPAFCAYAWPYGDVSFSEVVQKETIP